MFGLNLMGVALRVVVVGEPMDLRDNTNQDLLMLEVERDFARAMLAQSGAQVLALAGGEVGAVIYVAQAAYDEYGGVAAARENMGAFIPMIKSSGSAVTVVLPDGSTEAL